MKNVSINVSVPEEMAPYIFSDDKEINPNQHSGYKNQLKTGNQVAKLKASLRVRSFG